MATVNDTPTLDPVRQALRDVDQQVQIATSQITALCRAGEARIAMDPHALVDVREYFGLINQLIQFAGDWVNVEAEKHGANHVNAVRRAADQVLFSQHRAQTGAANG